MITRDDPQTEDGFHYYYKHNSTAQEAFFTNRLKLTWEQSQQVYKEYFDPEPNHLGVVVHRSVKSLAKEYKVSESTMSRYLTKERVRRLNIESNDVS